jgi:hypothetical protein
MPPRTFFDIAVVHLLTTSRINRLRELYPEAVSSKYLKINVLISSYYQITALHLIIPSQAYESLIK